LNGGTVPIDLEITSSNPLTSWIDKPVLQLDASYSAGNLASLKGHFTLENSKQSRDSPYTETPIMGYKTADDGKFVTE
jgi:hypothetical protein